MELFTQITGIQFKHLYPEKIFYIVLDKNQMYGGHIYENGINETKEEKEKKKKKERNAELSFIFMEEEKALINYFFGHDYEYYCPIEIMNDSIIYKEKDRYTTNKLTLNLDEKKKIEPYNKEKIRMRQQNVWFSSISFHTFHEIKEEEQTDNFCFSAIRQNPYFLQYIYFKKKGYCLEAVIRCGLVIKFIQTQPFDIVMEAVKQDPLSIQFVKEENRTPELCIYAIQRGAGTFVLEYLKPEFQTQEIKLRAIQNSEFKWIIP